MPATVYAYKNNNYTKRLGKTSKAFNCVITKELMREHTLQFLITNDNPFYNLICKDNVFECDGQMFDITEIDTESGESNITQIAAEHVSYRLSDFMIPDNYSFVGTLPQIVEDILEQGVNINDERASALFSAGECYDGLGSVTYSLIGQENITVRAALLGLTYLGVEVDFDNFKVNCPLRIGAEKGADFDFTTNLKKFRRRWERNNDWSYDVEIADRGDISLGDNVTVYDSFVGDNIQKRIITYSKCIDDPTKNAVTLGAFILDSAAASVETGLELEDLTSQINSDADKLDNLSEQVGSSVQQGKQYNNVAITHELGFVSTRNDSMVRVIANGTNCFAVQKNINGEWTTLATMTENGVEAEKPDGSLRVLVNTSKCFVVETKQDGAWVPVTQVDETGMSAGVLTTPGSQYFGTIGGHYKDGDNGFVLYIRPIDGTPEVIAKMVLNAYDQAQIQSPRDLVISAPNIIFADENETPLSNFHSIAPRGGRILLRNGLVVGVEGDGVSGQYVLNDKRFIFTNGCLMNVEEV